MTSSTTINLEPNVVNWQFQAGSTFVIDITYTDSTGTPINLTGYTARMMARTSYPELLPVIDISTTPNAQGAIVITPLTGRIVATVEATATDGLVLPEYAPYRFVYDLEIEDSGGIVTPLIKGQWLVTPEVTR